MAARAVGSRLHRMIPLNDLARHHAPLRAALEAAIARVNDRGHYILGPEVDAFEREFAAYCGTDACVAVGNGTDALELALRALGAGETDEVIAVANAGGYATTAIRATGATPVYVDVDSDLLSLDPNLLSHAITPRTRAIIVTHLYGRLVAIDAIARLAHERGVMLVEDCAQAHGASLDGRKAGSFGAVGCYSFYPTKNLGALGDAGALVTSSAALAARIAELRTYGWRGKYRVETAGGMNSRMDELQAAVLRVKLPHVDAWNARRRDVAQRYAAAIDNPSIELPPTLPGHDDVVHLYVVRAKERDALREHLRAAGVGTDIHYPIPDHRQPGWAAAHPPRLPHTERACAEVLTLPCYPELKEAEIAAVAAACNSWRPATRS